MPDTEFTRLLLEIVEVGKDVTNALVLSNWALNYLMQSSISFVWGLINSLQILSYFPLINLAMPANAHLFFQIIVHIANFEIVDQIDDVVDIFEDETGLIEDKEFILSDSFEDFGYTTTDIIENLSVIFLVFLLLLAAPLCFLILYGLLGWCRGCKKCLAATAGAIFMNSYIRFLLESYLELCLSSMLRFKMLVFGAASPSTHSVLSIVFLALLVIFPAFTGTYMMCRKE